MVCLFNTGGIVRVCDSDDSISDYGDDGMVETNQNGASSYMIKSLNLKKIFKEHATNLITSDNTSTVIYGEKSFVL